MTKLISRRNVLRSTTLGAAAALPLPFLDCFLDNSGKALAATGVGDADNFGCGFGYAGIIVTDDVADQHHLR